MDPKVDNLKKLQEKLTDRGLWDGSAIGNYNLSDEDISEWSDSRIASFLAIQALRTRSNHGHQMTNLYTSALKYLECSNPESPPSILPLQDAIDVVEVERDELGNRSILVDVNEDVIAQMLKEHFKSNPNSEFVNLSFLMGTFRIKLVTSQVADLEITSYTVDPETGEDGLVIRQPPEDGFEMRPNDQGIFMPHIKDENGDLVPLPGEDILTRSHYEELNQDHKRRVIENIDEPGFREYIEELDYPRSELTESYNSEFAADNLRRLLSLCDQFPEKNFIVSGGNENSNFYEIRKSLEDNGELPDNLIITAGEQKRGKECDGADIYVYGDDLGVNFESSQAATIMTSVFSALAHRGEPRAKIMGIIYSFCEEAEIITSSGLQRTVKVFKPEKFRNSFVESGQGR